MLFRSRHDADSLLLDRGLAVAHPGASLGLADHLARHEHDVSVDEVEPAEQRAEVGALDDLLPHTELHHPPVLIQCLLYYTERNACLLLHTLHTV